MGIVRAMWVKSEQCGLSESSVSKVRSVWGSKSNVGSENNVDKVRALWVKWSNVGKVRAMWV